MLVLGLDSACDVCLDGYDNDTKLPYSIQCGHVFCSQCIPSLPRDTCPICRASFSRSEVRRLHVDLDSVKATPEALEAKRLQAAIAKIANEGSSEQNLRQFIQEGKAFLTSQPRAMYKELRTSLKMISYMCDVRSTLKSRERELENISKQVQQLAQLQAENGLLQKQLQSSKKKRQEEHDQALAEQLTLKDHAAKAHAAYETMVDQYNFVVRQWIKVTDDFKQLRTSGAATPYMKANPDKDFDELEYSLEEIPYPSPELDQTALKGAAAQEPDSYLVSPLPQFTGKLPSHLDSFDPMPEVVEEEEEEGYEQAYAPAPNCGAAGHPHSCKCASFSMFPDDIQYAEPRASPTRRPSFVARESPSFPATATDRPVLADSFEAVTDTTPSTPSGLSLTAPPNLSVEGRRSRSQSVTVSRTPSRSRPTSRGPTRPVSPSLKPAMIPSSQPRASSSRDPYAPVSAHLSIPQGREGEGLRTRLHDLLQDTGVSSSLPSMSSGRFTSSSPNHHPSVIAREKQALREDLTSRPASPRSGSSDYRLPQESTTDGYSHLLASHPPAHGVSTPMTTPSPNPRAHTGASSSASRAAAELERAQNERRKAEKEEKERRRAEKDMQRGKLDNVYTTPDVDARPRTSSTTSSVQAMQREQYIYGNPNISPNGISVSRHSPSTGGAYSSKPLSSGVSSLRREPSNVSATYQSRGYPTGTGKVSNIMPAAPTTGIYT